MYPSFKWAHDQKILVPRYTRFILTLLFFLPIKSSLFSCVVQTDRAPEALTPHLITGTGKSHEVAQARRVGNHDSTITYRKRTFKFHRHTQSRHLQRKHGVFLFSSNIPLQCVHENISRYGQSAYNLGSFGDLRRDPPLLSNALHRKLGNWYQKRC